MHLSKNISFVIVGMLLDKMIWLVVNSLNWLPIEKC